MYLILEGKVGVGGVGEWFDRGRKRTDEFGGDIVAKTEQDEAGECGSGEDFGKLVSGDEFGGYGGGEGGEVGGNDVIDKGRDGDIRGGRVRRSDTEQGYEGIECCDGARDDDTVGFGCYVFRDHKAKEKVTKGNGLTKILLLMQSNCSHQGKWNTSNKIERIQFGCVFDLRTLIFHASLFLLLWFDLSFLCRPSRFAPQIHLCIMNLELLLII